MNVGLLFLILLLVGSLFGVTGLRQLLLQPLPETSSNLIWFGVQVLPLLALLPGLLARNSKAYVYAALVSLLYLIHGVLLAATPELRVLGIIEAVTALLLCVVASFAAKALRDQ